MFERFTTQARNVVVAAQEHARRLGHHRIEAEHLLLAVAASPTPIAEVLHAHGLTPTAIEATIARRRARTPFQDIDEQALAAIGIDLDRVRARVEDALAAQARRGPAEPERRRRGLFRRRLFSPGSHLPFSRSAKACLEGSLRESLAAHDGYLGVEHILLALIGVDAPTVRAALTDAGVSPASLRAAVRERYRQAG